MRSLEFQPIELLKVPEGETIWLHNNKTGFTALGNLVCWDGDWFWAVSNGVIYSEGRNIITECEAEDYEFTHFALVPDLPEREVYYCPKCTNSELYDSILHDAPVCRTCGSKAIIKEAK